MQSSLELLQTIIKSKNHQCLKEFLYFTSENKLFCRSQNKEEIVALINSLLHSNETYQDGLLILQHFFPQCPRDILNNNCLAWIQLCAKGLVNSENGRFCPLAFQLLGELISLSLNFPETRKQVALTAIPKILDHIICEGKRSKGDTLAIVLRSLEQILMHYGKSCSAHKEAITSFIFGQLESSPSIVFQTAKCFLYLAASGSRGSNAENYATSWLQHEKFLLNSLHNIMDKLFENITEVQDSRKEYDLGNDKPTIPKIFEKGIIGTQKLAAQFQSLAEFFRVLLLGAFPTPKKILPESILSVIWRGLSVNAQTLSLKLTFATTSLSTVISKINASCLNLLDALIVSCRMNLISFSSLVGRIISETLKWTVSQEWPYGVNKPWSSLRVKVYQCINNWLIVCGVSSGIDKYLNEILAAIVSDIHIELPVLALKVPKGKGKKRKERKETELKSEYLSNQSQNQEPCKAALNVLPLLLSTSVPFMKPTQHKLLQEKVINKLLSIQHGEIPVPYSNSDCRLGLYKVLLALCKFCHPSCPPPVNYASVILSSGASDSSIEVCEYCLHSLGSISNILNPVCLPLNFPSIVNDDFGIGIDASGLGDEPVSRFNLGSGPSTSKEVIEINENPFSTKEAHDDFMSFASTKNDDLTSSTPRPEHGNFLSSTPKPLLPPKKFQEDSLTQNTSKTVNGRQPEEEISFSYSSVSELQSSNQATIDDSVLTESNGTLETAQQSVTISESFQISEPPPKKRNREETQKDDPLKKLKEDKVIEVDSESEEELMGSFVDEVSDCIVLDA